MSSPTVFIVALILLLAVGLVTWASIAMAQVEEELGSLSGYEGMHFEIGPQAQKNTERARWPIPG